MSEEHFSQHEIVGSLTDHDKRLDAIEAVIKKLNQEVKDVEIKADSANTSLDSVHETLYKIKAAF